MTLTIPIKDEELEKKLYEMYQKLKSKDRSKTWTDLIRSIVEKVEKDMAEGVRDE